MGEIKRYWVKFTKKEKQEIKWFTFLDTRNMFLHRIVSSGEHKDISFGRLG